jgi:hypothetical protein
MVTLICYSIVIVVVIVILKNAVILVELQSVTSFVNWALLGKKETRL